MTDVSNRHHKNLKTQSRHIVVVKLEIFIIILGTAMTLPKFTTCCKELCLSLDDYLMTVDHIILLYMDVRSHESIGLFTYMGPRKYQLYIMY